MQISERLGKRQGRVGSIILPAQAAPAPVPARQQQQHSAPREETIATVNVRANYSKERHFRINVKSILKAMWFVFVIHTCKEGESERAKERSDYLLSCRLGFHFFLQE